MLVSRRRYFKKIYQTYLPIYTPISMGLVAAYLYAYLYGIGCSLMQRSS